jgi:hypothetical protein
VAHHDDVVGDVGDDAHVMRDDQHGRVEPVSQVAHEVEDLGLHRDVERGRGLVGDQQLRVARDRLCDHGALTLPARQLVRVGVERLQRVGEVDEVQQFQCAFTCPARRHAEVDAQRLDDLEPDRVDGVEGGHRLLEDHGDLAAADLAELLGLESQDLAAVEAHTSLHAGVLRQEAEHRHRAHALARPGLADDGEGLSALQRVAELLGRRNPEVVDREVDRQAVDFEEGSVVGAGLLVHREVLTSFIARMDG